MVVMVPDGVDVCISWVRREAHYYGVGIGDETYAFSLLPFVYGVLHTGNIPFHVMVSESGALSTATCPRCPLFTVGTRLCSIRIVCLLLVLVLILLRKVSSSRRFLQVPLRIFFRIRRFPHATRVRQNTDCPTFSAALLVTHQCIICKRVV